MLTGAILVLIYSHVYASLSLSTPTTTVTTYLVHAFHSLIPRPWDAGVRMPIAHATSPHDPLPHAVVLETAVGEQHFWEELKHDRADVCDGLVAGRLFLTQWYVFRGRKCHLVIQKRHFIHKNSLKG